MKCEVWHKFCKDQSFQDIFSLSAVDGSKVLQHPCGSVAGTILSMLLYRPYGSRIDCLR